LTDKEIQMLVECLALALVEASLMLMADQLLDRMPERSHLAGDH
jgi:hypothetical protein